MVSKEGDSMIAPYYFKDVSDKDAEREKTTTCLAEAMKKVLFGHDEETACGDDAERIGNAFTLPHRS
jgi:hypothetical protein